MLETQDLLIKQGSLEDGRPLYENLWSREAVFRYMFQKACKTEDAGREKTARYVGMQKEVTTEFFAYEKASRQAIDIAGIKALSAGIFTVTDIAIGSDRSGKGFGRKESPRAFTDQWNLPIC